MDFPSKRASFSIFCLCLAGVLSGCAASTGKTVDNDAFAFSDSYNGHYRRSMIETCRFAGEKARLAARKATVDGQQISVDGQKMSMSQIEARLTPIIASCAKEPQKAKPKLVREEILYVLPGATAQRPTSMPKPTVTTAAHP
jgi:hypothetical protein